ncbi:MULTISPECIES: acyl carrier protein [Bacillus]|uniref:acyl carrier protein n=1 Tax=Bacillus TaxID=1386 RepID=UPI000E2E631E|nr:acyl carrier protein [Bacillus subtilis]NLS89110.1 acyl carrier protein [Bacillus subtilis]CAF1827626.1 Acyl carrier protein [Bacillus subtilis]
MSETTSKKVRLIISDVAEMEIEQIDFNSDLIDDLGIDSMMTLEIVTELERTFHIKLEEEELQDITDVNSVIEVVSKKIK